MIEHKKYFIVGTNDNALHDTMNGNVIGELIRCKECKHYWENAGICVSADFPISDNTKPDDYCSRAERKEE